MAGATDVDPSAPPLDSTSLVHRGRLPSRDHLNLSGRLDRMEHTWHPTRLCVFQQPTLAGVYRERDSPQTPGRANRHELVRETTMEVLQSRLSGVSPLRRIQGVQPDGRGSPTVSQGEGIPVL